MGVGKFLPIQLFCVAALNATGRFTSAGGLRGAACAEIAVGGPAANGDIVHFETLKREDSFHVFHNRGLLSGQMD
jgi:hypothetical protein